MGQSVKFLSPAYVLHRRPYSDTSLLIDFFSLQFGRITCIAKGVKKAKTSKSAILQPFIPLMMNFSGRGEVKTLNQCESAGHLLAFSGNTLFTAYYVNELLLKALPKHEVFETLFSDYSLLIKKISEGEAFENSLRLFEKHLFEVLGYGLLLEYEAENGLLIEANKNYRYVFDKGPVECQVSVSYKDDMPVISGASLQALARGQLLNQMHLHESKLLMRYLIQHLLGGYVFKSREFFSNKERA